MNIKKNQNMHARFHKLRGLVDDDNDDVIKCTIAFLGICFFSFSSSLKSFSNIYIAYSMNNKVEEASVCIKYLYP